MPVDDGGFVILDKEDLEDYNVEGILPESAETIRTIRQWLQPTDFAAESSEYRKHLTSYVEGTGNWIQQTDTYKTWHESPSSASLLIKAIPGSGKSVFAAMIADKLAYNEKAPVLYFFFRQIIARNHDPGYLVRDWLCQLLPYSPSLQLKLKEHMQDGQSLDNTSSDELWHMLLGAVSSMPKVYCIVDALDEMDISKLGFLNHLVELGKQQHATIKVLMTSRPLPYIESILRSPSILQISILQIRLRQNMVDTDIAIYVKYRLDGHANVTLSNETRETIRNSICEKGQGSFLYAKLMLDKILHETTPTSPDSAGIEQIIKRLPVSLEDMYNKMLLDHSDRSAVSQELQLTILQWVTHSVRPLRLLELAALISFLDSTQRDFRDTKALVRKACGPLLEILEDETVSIIHHSFTEFLLDQEREMRPRTEAGTNQFPIIKSIDTQRFLALTCLKYLESGSLDELNLVSDPLRDRHKYTVAQKKSKIAFPLLDYAASNICTHFAKLEFSDKNAFESLDVFLRANDQALVGWMERMSRSKAVQDFSLMHIAASEGMPNYCQHLIQIGLDVNAKDSALRTPISWASARGHDDVVAVLLRNHADPDQDDKLGLKPLHYAAKGNHSQVVKLLLAAGVSPLTLRTKNSPGRRCGNAPSDLGATPVKYACQGGCTETIVELMKFLSAKELNHALGSAAREGKANVVIALLESPYISVDNTESGATPLFWAAYNHNPLIIQALLKKGANPNAVTNVRGVAAGGRLSFSAVGSEDARNTPLHSLAGLTPRRKSYSENEDILRECCKLLVDAGGDVNAIDDQGRYPIHYSTSPAITAILLERGAQATVTSNDGNTPLHLACENQANNELIEVLVRHGADVNARRIVDGMTPLHLLLKRPFSQSLHCFLNYKADVNATDNRGNTPLHVALGALADLNTIKTLLDAGADPNKKNLDMDSPMHVVNLLTPMRTPGTLDVLSILLQAGADLEACDKLGRTILLRSVLPRSITSEKVVKRLLEAGAKTTAQDIYGNTALHLACQGRPNLDLVRLLLKAGADPTCINHEGNTLLHEASRLTSPHECSEKARILEELLELGVPANQKNHSGATPLHIACSASGASLSSKSKHPYEEEIDLLLGPRSRIGIDEGDYNGIRAIHLAVTISEQLVHWLIEKGADPSVQTIEGQTPMQVACRARKTNMVGMLLEIYSNTGMLHLVDHKDNRGRTALHDACRSGRPETVKILLDAGASPNVRDNNGYTPLHVCAEFVEENVIWCSQRMQKCNDTGIATAAGLLISDGQRPLSPIQFPASIRLLSMWNSAISSEDDTVRIRSSIRLLIAHGAALTETERFVPTPLYLASCTGSEVMVDELLHVTRKAFEESGELDSYSLTMGDAFATQYLRLRSKYSPEMVAGMAHEGQDSYCWNKLLRLDDERLFDELIKRRVDFFNSRSRNKPFPSILATWGYATLLEKLGHEVSTYQDLARLKESEESVAFQSESLLTLACYRELPNMEVIRVLVEKFGIDVNVRPTMEGCTTTGDGALHILARGNHWWYIQALDYLIQRGADIEMRNENGESPLAICINKTYPNNCWRYAVADMLLRHGANPNSRDQQHQSCLDKAGADPEMVRKLIRHGADINSGHKPAIFAAISSNDLATVEAILDSGAGFESRCKRKDPPESSGLPIDVIPPLHYAASYPNNTKDKKERATPIVKLLLNKGANPYEIINEQVTVVHDVFANSGIAEPFLELPALDLEHRDPLGRTLFLAACDSPNRVRGPGAYMAHREEENAKNMALVLHKMGADITARDSKRLNALHHLLLVDSPETEQVRYLFLELIKAASPLIHQKTQEGNTPLHLALQRNRLWSVDVLLSNGSNPVEPDSDGNTALHYLARNTYHTPSTFEQKKLFHSFLTLGVPINARNKLGQTALFSRVALDAGADSLLEDFNVFQDAGADFLTRNNDMETLLHILAKRAYYGPDFYNKGHKECDMKCFRYLMEKGCDPLAEDVNQRTALDVAAACGSDHVLSLFQRDGDSKTS